MYSLQVFQLNICVLISYVIPATLLAHLALGTTVCLDHLVIG